MDKNKANVPKIRFPGFTDPWEQRKVKDIFKVTRGYVLAATETTDKKTDETPYPVYSYQTKDNGLLGYYKNFLYENAITWTTDGANAGTVNYRAGKFYCTNVCGVLLSDDGYANKMVSEVLNNISWKYVSKVGNPKLMNNVMSEIVVLLPKTIEEQNTISDFLDRLDDLITLHQRKLNHLQDKKKGLLQKMFPKNGEDFPELRFPGFTDPWEQRKFCDYYKICSGYAFKYQDYVDDGVTIVNGESIQHGKVDSAKFNYLPESFRKDYLDFLLYEGDIVVGLNRPIIDGKLKISRIPRNLDGSLLYQRAGKIKFITDIDVDFSYVLLEKEILKYTRKEAVGSDQPFISTSKLDKWKMMFPKSEDEKVKIGLLFKNFDNLITLHQRKLNHLQEQKKALLQQMFI